MLEEKHEPIFEKLRLDFYNILDMKTLQVAISQNELDSYHLLSSHISFDELREKISNKLAKDALLKCHQIAEETELSKMTLEEINNEIAAVRSDAQTRR